MSKVFFVVQSEIMTGGVIEAQVIASLRAQCAVSGQPPTRLIFLESWRQVAKPEVRATLRKFRALWPEGRISLVPYSERVGGAAAPGLALALALWRERFSRDDLIFHCRAPAATLSADYARQRLGRGRVIFDVRGASPYEALHRRGYPWRENLPPAIEQDYQRSLARDRSAAQVADELFVVSPGLREYALNELGASAEHLNIVPSCVAGTVYDAQTRAGVRREWGVPDDAPVLLYSGRIGAYRAPEQIFRLLAAVLRRQPSALLVIFSYLDELSRLSELLAATGVPFQAVRRESHTRDEVLHRACAADVGLVFCEPALRYLYGFPIKVPEYLAAGVPLCVTDSYEQIPALVQEKSIGWVAGAEWPPDTWEELAETICHDLSKHRKVLRDRALAVCEEQFTWSRYLPQIRRAYGCTS